MIRPASYVIRLGATALLVGAVAAGCAGHDRAAANGPIGSSPASTALQTDAAEALQPTPAPTAVDAPAPADSPTDSPTATETPSAPGATTDPLDATFSDIDQLLSGVNGALSGSDASASGGE
ncbi:MAG TPA: hypothetical protein VF349_03585 [Candidatus Limnocylindrales bacterium]